MNELVQFTFGAAPPEFQVELGDGDANRQPEEIMESYYHILEDKLFTVFQLLEQGRPNANHVAMARLAKAGKVRAIFTTNFDIFIERALRDEGVEFETVVTAEDFEKYQKGGCAKFAVLKIHGTVDRPETIVAVANHYKMGKGFSGAKADVLAKFVKECPTLFLGYSGWDFLHKNYQEFWERAGAERSGKNVFWLTLKGFGGGPDLGKVVGIHLGKRLRIGASMLPDWSSDVVDTYLPGEGTAIMTEYKAMDSNAIFRENTQQRHAFLKKWVSDIPKAQLLSLICLEGQQLNSKMQERQKKAKSSKGKEMKVDASADDAMKKFSQMASDLATKKITQEEYDTMMFRETAAMTIKYVNGLSQAQKDELVDRLAKVAMNPSYNQATRSMLPGATLAAANNIERQNDFALVLSTAERFVKELGTLSDDTSERGKLKYRIYQALIGSLPSCSSEDEAKVRVELDVIIDKGLKEKWSEDEWQIKIARLYKLVQKYTYGLIDVNTLLEAVVIETMACETDEMFLQSVTSCALAHIRMSQFLSNDFMSIPAFQAKLSGVLYADGASVDISLFREFEDLFLAHFIPLFSRLAKMDQTAVLAPNSALKTPGEAKAALEITAVVMWLPLGKYWNDSMNKKTVREEKGLYPRECLPKCLSEYLLPRCQSASSVVNDPRLQQPLLQLMVYIAESLGDVDLIRDATNASLALTQGKVTELTPETIPESLAAALDEKGELKEALEWYDLALDGIKTSATRSKVDAIVLNACLAQGRVDQTKALKWAFSCSPFFASTQGQIAGMLRGVGRELLIQQVEAWAKELGFESVIAAEQALMSAEE